MICGIIVANITYFDFSFSKPGLYAALFLIIVALGYTICSLTKMFSDKVIFKVIVPTVVI